LVAGDELAREEWVELLVFDVVPIVESSFGHDASAFLMRVTMAEMNFLLCVARCLV
jgi:hypothetical protein